MAEKRSKTSLAFRLNAKLFLRQLRTLLALDFMILILFTAGFVYYKDAETVDLLLEYTAPPSSGAGRNRGDKAAAEPSFVDGVLLRDSAGLALYWTDQKPDTFYLPEDIVKYLPQPMDTLYLGRRLLFMDGSGQSPDDQIMSMVYELSMGYAGGWLVAETPIGLPVFIFSRCLIIILILEAISLLRTVRRNGRSINKTLQPLQELTATTQALTAIGGRLSPEALKRLTGALDSFNVSHLDARLPLTGISDELKPLAEAINEMLTRIDEAYRSQIQFVSDASHELRTPIAVIQGYADLLTRWGTEDPDTMKESIAAIRQEAASMKAMVEQLLFLARGDNAFTSDEWKAVDVSQLASEVFREVEMIDEGHRFTSGIAPGIMVRGNEGMLKQLMRILMDNSIKYTSAQGQISLRVEEREGQAAIVVQDEGVGIPPETIPRIFDRFYRADESRTRNTGGAGLGLSIAKWIAQRHDGLIEVTSREKIGTRMTVLLPLLSR